MRLLCLYTANVEFSFPSKSYLHFDEVAMGSPLGPILADLFMAELEEKIAMNINDVIFYHGYVDIY